MGVNTRLSDKMFCCRFKRQWKEVNNKFLTFSQVSRAFATYGKVFCCEYQSELKEYLTNHADNFVYWSFLSNEQFLDPY